MPSAVAPGQDGSQVEAESVDVHVGDPVAEAVGDQPHGTRMQDVEAVAGARVVDVVPGVFRGEPVVDGIVDAPERQRGSEMVPLAGVVVDHVEDDFDPGPVQRPHHRLELVDLLAETAGGVADMGGEEGDGVVAPVVGEPPGLERTVGDEMVDGHELDRRDSQPEQVVDDRVRGQSEVGAAQVRRDPGMLHGHAAHVRLVNDGPVPRRAGRTVVLPGEGGVDHDGLGERGRRVAAVEREIGLRVAHRVAEQVVVPVDEAAHRLGIRIDEEFVGVETVAVRRLVRSVDLVAVQRPGAHVG